MTKAFFISGTGTGVGKTLITAALCHQLTQEGYTVKALKPVVSGFCYDDPQSDPAIILQGLGHAVTREAVDGIAPWRFTLPLSPHMAAQGKCAAPSTQEVSAFCKKCAKADIVLIEGAGGIMTPLNDSETMLDLAVTLAWPVLLVAGSYLGAISHTLTALRALSSAGLRVHAVVISESADGVSLTDTARTIRGFASEGALVYSVPRLAAQENSWQHLPNLTALCL